MSNKEYDMHFLYTLRSFSNLAVSRFLTVAKYHIAGRHHEFGALNQLQLSSKQENELCAKIDSLVLYDFFIISIDNFILYNLF